MVNLKFTQEEENELKKLKLEIKEQYSLDDVWDMMDIIGDEVVLHFNEYGEPADRTCIVLEDLITKLTSVEGY